VLRHLGLDEGIHQPLCSVSALNDRSYAVR
jgi:hypothetical protein